jgi:large subunit ribosomal protein L11
MKKNDVLSYDLKSATKEVIGSGVPFNMYVEGKPVKDVQKEIDEGKYDEYF